MPLTVLVADDSPTIQNKAKGILTGEGLDVVTVSNGVAAIKKLSQLKPQLILADVAMPGRDGYEVCDFVKNSPDLHDVAVVLIFSDADPYNEEQGARVRADGTIRKMAAGKPFVPEELISTVTKFINRLEGSAPTSGGPAVPSPDRSVVTEPVDAEPEFPVRKGVDVSLVPPGFPFAVLPDTESSSWATQSPSSEGGLAGGEDIPADTVPGFEPPRSTEEAPAADRPPAEDLSLSPEPLLIEEPPPPAPPAIPESERTVIYRRPSAIADPRLSDDLEPTPPPELLPTDEDSGHGGVAATTLEGFSLTDAASGGVRFGSQPAAGLDHDLVHRIVQKVVSKMSPRALPQETIDDMARKLADEIIAELNSEHS